MSRNKLIILIVSGLAIAIMGNIILASNLRRSRVELGDTKRQHKKEINASKRREEALMNEVKKSEARVLGLEHFIASQEAQLQLERAAKNKWQKEYAKVLQSHVDRTTSNDELDSLVTRLLTEH